MKDNIKWNFTDDGVEDIDDDKDIELTDDDLEFSALIDKMAEDEARAGNRSDRISKELIESLVDEMRQMKFMFTRQFEQDSPEFSQDMTNAINNKISCIAAIYEKGKSIPKKCFMTRLGNSLGSGLVGPDDDVRVVLEPLDAAYLFCENKGIKYRTAQAIEDFLRESAPECFKERKENYINPAAIADPASRQIMSMNIPVDEHKNLKRNFELLIDERGTDYEECNDIEGIEYIDSEPVFTHAGSYRGHSTMISIYLCLTRESLQKKSVICPDCLVICNDEVDGSTRSAIFNLKTGYNKREMKWKADYGSITRKIKTILKEEEMTDFKQQDSNRGKRGRA